MRLKGARIVVVGAGGAARAAVFGLVEQGADVTIVNRTHEKAAALARKAKAHVLKQNVLSKQKFDAIIDMMLAAAWETLPPEAERPAVVAATHAAPGAVEARGRGGRGRGWRGGGGDAGAAAKAPPPRDYSEIVQQGEAAGPAARRGRPLDDLQHIAGQADP